MKSLVQTPGAPSSVVPAKKHFKPATGQAASARLASADAQTHFASPSPFSSPKAVDAKQAEQALTACFIAISAWRKFSGSLESGTPGWLEAQLALANLYSMRGMLCKRNYEELISSGKRVGIWALRAGEAVETALSHFKAVAAQGENGMALKRAIKDAHEEIFWSYYTAAALISNNGRPPFPLPKLAALGDLPGKASEYALKAACHGAESSRQGFEIYGES